MKRSLVTVCILALPIAVALLTARSSTAGPEKIEFPANWEKYVLYTIVDRYDVKQYRELYASSQEAVDARSEEHTSELQSQSNLVCRLLLEKKKNNITTQSQH